MWVLTHHRRASKKIKCRGLVLSLALREINSVVSYSRVATHHRHPPFSPLPPPTNSRINPLTKYRLHLSWAFPWFSWPHLSDQRQWFGSHSLSWKSFRTGLGGLDFWWTQCHTWHSKYPNSLQMVIRQWAGSKKWRPNPIRHWVFSNLARLWGIS